MLAPDLAARKVIVAAYLYYVMDSPTMSDGEYDKLSQYVAEHWDKLDPVRQWQLGDAASTRAGGSHIKFTAYAVGAARNLYWQTHKRYSVYPYPTRWKKRKEDDLRYVTAV